MSTEQNAFLAFRVPLDDQVGQADRAAGLRMPGAELLESHPAAELFKMRLEIRLLPLHAFGAADPRADGAEILEIAEGPLAVERDVTRLELRSSRTLPGQRGAVVPDRQGCEKHNESSRQNNVGPGEFGRGARRAGFAGGSRQGNFLERVQSQHSRSARGFPCELTTDATSLPSSAWEQPA